nr:hypothetical protein CFP56_76405 [Quercus suber]
MAGPASTDDPSPRRKFRIGDRVGHFEMPSFRMAKPGFISVLRCAINQRPSCFLVLVTPAIYFVTFRR